MFDVHLRHVLNHHYWYNHSYNLIVRLILIQWRKNLTETSPRCVCVLYWKNPRNSTHLASRKIFCKISKFCCTLLEKILLARRTDHKFKTQIFIFCSPSQVSFVWFIWIIVLVIIVIVTNVLTISSSELLGLVVLGNIVSFKLNYL